LDVVLLLVSEKLSISNVGWMKLEEREEKGDTYTRGERERE
jgi:hypothetical protein